MKNNQYDLIFAIVAGVFAIGFALGFFFMKREPVAPGPAPKPALATPALPAAAVPHVASLPGGGAAGGGGAFGMGGPRGGAGMMGRPGPAGASAMGGPPMGGKMGAMTQGH